MERVNSLDKCPRCASSPHPLTGVEDGATSRASMSDVPVIAVCATCREREVHRGSAGMPLIPFSRWPVSIETLLAEDRLRLSYKREHPVGELISASRRRAAANLDR
jgi:hypothetical protein